jgi:hypothetical protein
MVVLLLLLRAPVQITGADTARRFRENTEDQVLLFMDERHSGARVVDGKSSKSGAKRG